jgi:hypothetical protein
MRRRAFVRFASGGQRTYWLMRRIAMSSLSVYFLNCCSMLSVVVSSFMFHANWAAARTRGVSWARTGRGTPSGARVRSKLTRVDDKVVGPLRGVVLADTREKKAGGGVLVADDGDEEAARPALEAARGRRHVTRRRSVRWRCGLAPPRPPPPPGAQAGSGATAPHRIIRRSAVTPPTSAIIRGFKTLAARRHGGAGRNCFQTPQA